MRKSFLSDFNEAESVRFSLDVSIDSEPEREAVRLLAIGSRRGVLRVIQILHVKGVAEIGAWSPLLPGPNPNEVMSILTLNLVVE